MKFITSLLFMFALINCGPKTVKELKHIKIFADTQLRLSTSPWDHSPYYLLDANPKTVWCGEGENLDSSIIIQVSDPIKVNTIKIINGLSQTQALSTTNPQISKLSVSGRLSENDKFTEPEVVDVKQVSFANEKEPKAEDLKLAKSIVGREFKFIIKDIHPGKKSKNLCITSLQLGFTENDKTEIYPIANKSEIEDKIKDLEKSKSHNVGLIALKSLSQYLLIFCSQKGCMPIRFKEDFTFDFDGYEPIIRQEGVEGSDAGIKPKISGTYKVENFSGEGLEITINYFSSSGAEAQETWILKRPKKDEETFEKFKMLMASNFSNFDPKKTFLLALYNKNATDEIFFNYEIPFDYKNYSPNSTIIDPVTP
jgi:hypothetical protein